MNVPGTQVWKPFFATARRVPVGNPPFHINPLADYPEDAPQKSLQSLPRDLTRDLNLVHAATASTLSSRFGRPIGDDAFEIRIEQLDEHVYVADTNIGERFGLDEGETDKVIETGLLAIAGLNQRLEEIEAYRAMVGFRDGELPLAQEKLRFLLKEVGAEAQEERFGRVLALADLPDPETAPGTVDVEKLLEVRQTSEIREFRHWLRVLDEATDNEIEERVRSVTARLSEAVHSGTGKAVRFVATTGVGFIPIVGPIAGIALGAADQFVLEKLLPAPGPVSFIGSTYRSLFRS